MTVKDGEDDIPRIPRKIWKDLRKKLKEIDEGFQDSKNAEACAMSIQQLQHEFEHSKKFHIGLAPEPGKLLLTDILFS